MAKPTAPSDRHLRALTHLKGAKLTRTQLAEQMGICVKWAGILLKDLERFGMVRFAGEAPPFHPTRKGPPQQLWTATTTTN